MSSTGKGSTQDAGLDSWAVIADVCARADLVIIGIVREVDSREEQFHLGSAIVSDAIIEVVVPIRGRASYYERIALTVVGGTVNGRSMRSSSDPFFLVGQRYLLLLHDPGSRGKRGVSIQDPGRMFPRDERLYIVGGEFGATLLPPELNLPSNDEMRLMWEGVCGGSPTSRGAQ